MKKGQTYEGVVKSISFPNKGLVETKVFRLKKNEQEITPEMLEETFDFDVAGYIERQVIVR